MIGEGETKAMEPVQWSTWMSVGIEKLDEDHRILIGIVNKLAVDDSRHDPVVIEGILHDLCAYTRHHFSAEEEVMVRAAFPGYHAHKALHDSLTKQVDAYLRLWQQNRDSLLGEEMFGFCSDWLARHILKEDAKYGSHLKSGT
jgi:hemerythrin